MTNISFTFFIRILHSVDWWGILCVTADGTLKKMWYWLWLKKLYYVFILCIYFYFMQLIFIFFYVLFALDLALYTMNIVGSVTNCLCSFIVSHFGRKHLLKCINVNERVNLATLKNIFAHFSAFIMHMRFQHYFSIIYILFILLYASFNA